VGWAQPFSRGKIGGGERKMEEKGSPTPTKKEFLGGTLKWSGVRGEKIWEGTI